jgi:MYXO-CTERM domain-containing protein
MKAHHLLLPALGLSVATPAMAWRHTSFVWSADQIPVQFVVADLPNNSDGFCQDRNPVGECRAVAEFAADTWNNVPCTDLVIEIPPETADNEERPRNGINEIIFEDPGEEIEAGGDPGTIAWSQSNGTGALVEVNGQLYSQLLDADITFGKSRNLLSDELAAAQGCRDELSFNSTMVHEIGHSLGLAHSCEEEDICVDPALREATMFWTSKGSCDTSRSDLADDDVNALQALYGPIATFGCAGENDNGAVLGVVPFDLSCVVTSNRIADISGVEWVWGDGGVSDGLAGGHTYETPGNFTIQVTVDGESDACGEDGASGTWSYDYRRVGYVTSCDVVQGEFTAEFKDDLTYQMVNNSDVSVYGCISEIQWAIFEGEGTSGEPIQTLAAWDPVITFPDKGTYTILMNLGGPAGTSGATLTVDVGGSAAGCSTSAAGAGTLGGLGLFGLLGLTRRR